MGWHSGGDWDGGAWLAMGLGMLVFWAAVITVVVLLVRAWGQGRHLTGSDESKPIPPVEDARRILEQRFDRGEIDEDDYRHRRDVLDQR